MLYILKTVSPLACLLAFAGCDRAPSPSAPEKIVQDPIAKDVDQMQTGIRIAAANKRIDELERQVGVLQATPEKLDLDLLTRRVEALEASAHGDAATVGTLPGRSAFTPDQASRLSSRPTTALSDKPKKSSKLSIPELENGSRLATPDEAKSFNRTK